MVRRDREPLAKETVETMCSFHFSLNGPLRLPHEPTQVTPTTFREFSAKYWTEEAARLERGRYRHPSIVHRVFNGLIKRK